MRLRYGLIISALPSTIFGFAAQFGYAQDQPIPAGQPPPTTNIPLENGRIFNGYTAKLKPSFCF